MSEYIHTLVYGISGSGKSRFAATAPGPRLVFFFDGTMTGMDRPYLKLGEPQELTLMKELKSGDQIFYRDIINREDDSRLEARIIYFDDMDPEKPYAFRFFKEYISRFCRERKFMDYETIIVDSITLAVLMARWEYTYHDPPIGKNGIEIGYWPVLNKTTSALENIFLGPTKGITKNFILIGHATYVSRPDAADSASTATQKANFDLLSGGSKITIDVPGRLKTDLFPIFGEVYVIAVDKNGDSLIVTDRNSPFTVKSINQIQHGTPANWEEVCSQMSTE